MSKENAFTPERLVALALLAPFYALYGLFLLVRALVRLRRKARGLRLALATEIHCPNGHPNPAVGRFECAACKATYHGWVGRCGVCGAGAAWIPCDVCGVAIPLPWEQ
jgi:hypothetical protein